MHHRWVLAPNLFQMVSQFKFPSKSLDFLAILGSLMMLKNLESHGWQRCILKPGHLRDIGAPAIIYAFMGESAYAALDSQRSL